MFSIISIIFSVKSISSSTCIPAPGVAPRKQKAPAYLRIAEQVAIFQQKGRPFSGAILHTFCIFNRSIGNNSGYVVQSAGTRVSLRHLAIAHEIPQIAEETGGFQKKRAVFRNEFSFASGNSPSFLHFSTGTTHAKT